MKKKRKLPGQSELHVNQHQRLTEFSRDQDSFERRKQFDVARGLRSLRLQLHFTQAEMAKVIGVSMRTYAAYENADRDVPSGAIAEIFSRFDVNLHTLLTGEAETPQEKMAFCDYVFEVMDTVVHRFPDLDQNEAKAMTRQYIKYAELGEQVDGGKLLQCYDVLFKPDAG